MKHLIAAALLVSGAATLAGGATDEAAILKTVNDRLAREFISHDGLLRDYVGDIPTPEEIADLKPNAMGWWCPLENGSMFTGEWLPALMAEGPSRFARFARSTLPRAVADSTSTSSPSRN